MSIEKVVLYNDKIKRRYIDMKESEVTLSPGFLQNIFRKSSLFEEKFGKDLCEWTLTEIIEFYKYQDLYSIESLALLNSNYSLYTNWCLTETLVPDGQNHFLEVDYNVMTSCINDSLVDNTILTREEFEKCADTLPNYSDRFVFYSLFEGISGKQFEEITKAKLSDISGNVIRLCTGRIVAITSKFKEIASASAAEETYQSYGESGYSYKCREDDDHIYKMVVNKRQNNGNDDKNRAQVIGRRYVNAIDYLGLPRQLTPKKLMMSGKIDYIKRLMKSEDLFLEETLAKYKDEINEKYPVGKFGPSFVPFLRKYRRFFEQEISCSYGQLIKGDYGKN